MRSKTPTRPIFFRRIDERHCDRIHSYLTAVRSFDNGYVVKQPVAWKEYCAEYFLKDLQENMDRCTGRRDVTEILLKTALNTRQSINQSINQSTFLKQFLLFESLLISTSENSSQYGQGFSIN